MANLSFLENLSLSFHHPARLSKTDTTKLENVKMDNLKFNYYYFFINVELKN